jgi:hypothetical protein
VIIGRRNSNRGGLPVRQRLPLILSATALLVSLLGATPLGHAAARAVGVPFAKKAGFARKASLAYEALRLNGHRASLTPLPNQIPVVGSDGKLPASIGAVGPKGDRGAKGDKGDPGATKVILRRSDQTLPVGYGGNSVSCLSGEKALGGGAGQTNGNSGTTFQILDSKPTPLADGSTPTGWSAAAINLTGTVTWSVWVICAQP